MPAAIRCKAWTATDARAVGRQLRPASTDPPAIRGEFGAAADPGPVGRLRALTDARGWVVEADGTVTVETVGPFDYAPAGPTPQIRL